MSASANPPTPGELSGLAVRDRIEAGFERWGLLVCRWRWPIIALGLLLSASLISQLPRLRIDTSIEGFLHADDPILAVYNTFKDDFDRDDRIFLAIHPPAVFDLGFLAKLKAFHDEIEAEVPYVDEVTSLVNARSTRGEKDELIVEDLLEDWPQNAAQLAIIENRVRSNPLYQNLLISEDARYTTVSLKLSTYSEMDPGSVLEGFEEEEPTPARSGPRVYMTGEEGLETMAALRRVIDRHASEDLEIYIAGPPVMNERLTNDMSRDMSRFLGLSFLAACGFLFLLFRRVSGALLPAGVVLLSLLSTLGLAAILGFPIQVPTQVLPSFLMAVGIGDSVHLLTIFYQRIRAGAEKREAISFALGHSGLAILMTSITTAGALLSFAATDLKPISNLGLMAPMGVMLALLYSITLLPALLAVTPLRRKAARAEGRLGGLDRALGACARLAIHHPGKVVATWLVIIAVSLTGALQLRFSHNPLAWFPEGDEIRVAWEVMNKELRGLTTIEVLFDTEVENGLHEPALLDRLAAIGDYNERVRFREIYIGKTTSIVDMLKEIHQALNENQSSYHRVPRNRQLIAQELLLFENSGSDDLEDVVDSLFSTGRMTLKIPWTDAIDYPPLLDELSAHYREMLGEEVSVTVTGLLPLLSRTFEAVITSMAKSYVIAFVIISLLMILLLGSLRAGLVSMIPNLAPIVITLAVMAWFDLPLDAFTLLIGSIALGLAVDDTIHFMHNFRRYHDRYNDAPRAIEETLATTGQAMFVTTLVLCTGFFIFMLATMRSVILFGFLTGFALLLAFLADVILAPALMILVTRYGALGSSPRPIPRPDASL